jgi:hypothetical protein
VTAAPSLFGREGELALVDAMLDGLPGQGAGILITGDAGMLGWAVANARQATAA